MKTFNSSLIRKDSFVRILDKVYGNRAEEGYTRILELEEIFLKNFKNEPFFLFSSPGRVEICGNHTDHNHGKVVAAAVKIDTLAMVTPGKNNKVTLISQGYGQVFSVNLANILPLREERGTTSAMIRGIAAAFQKRGYKTGGFNACLNSGIPPGSGLSSSASFEVLVGEIFNTLYNENKISQEEIARIGQYAENYFFGKPCGLMDQIACAFGGIVYIDFKELQNPRIKHLSFDLLKRDYCMLVVNTGGSHADLTGDYAAIRDEMKRIAGFFKKDVCREISLQDIYDNINALRSLYGDRAVLRAIHYMSENIRVADLFKAIKKIDIKGFLDIIKESGESSCSVLQNCFSFSSLKKQGLMLALAVSRNFLNTIDDSACRVHGGGFAGTILVFLPQKFKSEYIALMNQIFGENSVVEPEMRDFGVICLNSLL